MDTWQLTKDRTTTMNKLTYAYRGLGSVDPLEVISLNARALDLDNCGSPTLRRPDLYVEFPVSYVYQLGWDTSADTQYFFDERRPVSTKGDFLLDRVCGVPVEGVNLRFVWPSGRSSANTQIPSSHYFAYGDYMTQFLDPVVIPSGQWIGLEISIDANTSAATFTMSFDGRIRYYLQPHATQSHGQ